MTDFVDAYMPSGVVGYPCIATPRFNTTITVAGGGDEGNNQNWLHPLRHFKLPQGVRDWPVLQSLIKQFLVLAGPHLAFAFRDPTDFASVDLNLINEPMSSVLARVTSTDMPLGTGDGVTRSFQLTKTYTFGGQTYTRAIELPVLANLLVSDNGGAAGAYTCSRPGGVVTFTSAPAAGHALKWGGNFDVPVRFDADDALDAMVQNFQVAGFSEINLDEIRLC